MSDLPAQITVALATVVASLITGVLALVNLTLGKETKVSEMRQAWIDGLREDLADFLSGVAIATGSLQQAYNADQGRQYVFKFGDEVSVAAVRSSTAALDRVRLRLNPNESEHAELERLLNAVADVYNSGLAADLESRVIEAARLARNQARVVLKLEWGRVKRGEAAFVLLRRWVVPGVAVLAIGFLAVIFLARFR